MADKSGLSALEFEREAMGHLGGLLAVGTRLTRSRTDAEDLVQDTLVKAMRARDHFQPGTNMRAWLLRILTNTFINRYRRGGREKALFEGPTADPLSDGWISATSMRSLRDAEGVALQPMLEAEISRALDELPDDFRAVVLLADVEEMGYREVAEIVGCPIGTVMSRLHRGRQLLKARLYQHALEMGIVAPETEVGKRTGALVPEPAPAPVDLATYRSAKGAKR